MKSTVGTVPHFFSSVPSAIFSFVQYIHAGSLKMTVCCCFDWRQGTTRLCPQFVCLHFKRSSNHCLIDTNYHLWYSPGHVTSHDTWLMCHPLLQTGMFPPSSVIEISLVSLRGPCHCCMMFQDLFKYFVSQTELHQPLISTGEGGEGQKRMLPRNLLWCPTGGAIKSSLKGTRGSLTFLPTKLYQVIGYTVYR